MGDGRSKTRQARTQGCFTSYPLQFILEAISGNIRRRRTANACPELDEGNADEIESNVSLDTYRDWIDDERIVVNVNALYCDFAGGGVKPNAMDMHARMARYRREHGRGRGRIA